MRIQNFLVIIEHDKDGYVAECLDLQGCYTQGKTYEEALRNIEDAIKLHVVDRTAKKEKFGVSEKSFTLSNLQVAI